MRDLKKFFGQRHEVIGRQPAMALVHRLGPEPNSPDIPGQAIGILRHDPHGISAVGLVDANRPCRADAMAVQEDHDLADRLLLGPGGRDAAGSHRTDAVHAGDPAPPR